jgi:hypothetical protein
MVQAPHCKGESRKLSRNKLRHEITNNVSFERSLLSSVDQMLQTFIMSSSLIRPGVIMVKIRDQILDTEDQR